MKVFAPPAVIPSLPLEEIVMVPAEAVKVIPVPAAKVMPPVNPLKVRTPIFVIVTAPVAPDTEIPVPATAVPTPVTVPVSPLKLLTMFGADILPLNVPPAAESPVQF